MSNIFLSCVGVGVLSIGTLAFIAPFNRYVAGAVIGLGVAAAIAANLI